MSDVEFRFRLRFKWWARPLLHLAILVRSLRLVEFVRDRGFRLDLAR